MIDLGCGTGRFLDFVKQAWPRLPVLGLDLSQAYIRHARRHLERWSCVNLIVANAEGIPAQDNSCDAVTSVFMLHELPARVRRTVIGEAARVLKPGGRLILVDSLQRGNEPAYDAMRAVLSHLYTGGFCRGRPALRTCAPAQHQGVRVESDGVRQGGWLTNHGFYLQHDRKHSCGRANRLWRSLTEKNEAGKNGSDGRV